MSVERFIYSPDASGCWIWQGSMDRNGYGRLYDAVAKRAEWAHRYSYAIHKGALIPGHEIDHVCQVTACVNPDHLDQVTRIEHVRRTFQRLGKDELHQNAASLRRRGFTYAEIAEMLNYAGKESAHAAVKSAINKGLISADEVPRVTRLTDEDRADIRLMYALGFPQAAIAQMYGVDSSQVSRVCSGRSSGHGNRDAA